MKRLAIIPLAAAAFAAAAQIPAGKEASEAEGRAVISIAQCLAVGLPEEWQIAVMDINLDKPYDETGGVRYFMARSASEEPTEPFTPCDVKYPAKTLIDARNSQAEARRGWIGARVTVFRDGRYNIRYGYPK